MQSNAETFLWSYFKKRCLWNFHYMIFYGWHKIQSNFVPEDFFLLKLQLGKYRDDLLITFPRKD